MTNDDRRNFLVKAGCAAVSLAVAGGVRAAEASGPGIPDAPVNLDQLPANEWVMIHRQRLGEDVVFPRQRHGGSAFDTRRGRIVLFGSDTHGEDWTNTPLIFDLGTRAWSRLYRSDPPSTYRVNDEGLPVAGRGGDHPWAMHTFGAVDYDPVGDRLIVSSYPAHLEPGRFTSVLAPIWPAIRRHPTWILEMETATWRPLPEEAPAFFAFATVYDPHQRVIIGYHRTGVHALSLETLRWRRLADHGLKGYSLNAVYDTRHRALVVFGGTPADNDIAVYEPETDRHEIMPTPGPRPPAGRNTPMAFHDRLGMTAVIVDRASKSPDARTDSTDATAELWLYDLGADTWTRIETDTLPFPVGMNFNMTYDPGHDILLLVADPPGNPVSVFALRL